MDFCFKLKKAELKLSTLTYYLIKDGINEEGGQIFFIALKVCGWGIESGKTISVTPRFLDRWEYEEVQPLALLKHKTANTTSVVKSRSKEAIILNKCSKK